MQPRPIQRRASQRFGFGDNGYEAKPDDGPCRKNGVVPYDELYALKGVPLHSPEAVKRYVDRKRCKVCYEGSNNLPCGSKKRGCGTLCESDKEKRK